MNPFGKLAADLEKKLTAVRECINSLGSIREEAFEGEVQSKLTELRNELERLLVDKLEPYYSKISSGLMEVAFAGAEKTGKSTFINAFIEKNILPSAHERTTFTVTELLYSPEGKVEVTFYTKDEFNKEVLQKLLQLAHYPAWDRTDFDSVSWGEVEKHFKRLSEEKPEIYKSIQSQVDNDLKDILRDGREIIKDLLNRPKSVYREEEVENYKAFIVDRYKSRAVKEVRIYTPKLELLKNVVIYDLPGFDSPTIVHSKFTEEKLKKVDAVVFVKKLIEPSIKGPELQMINKVREEDGVELKEKTFFFLNQADFADDRHVLEDDRAKFIRELKEREVYVSDDRVLAGSARAVLQKLGAEDGKKEVLKKAEQLGILDSIDVLKQKLREFYESERLKHIERRVNAVLDKIREKVQETIDFLTLYSKEAEFYNPVDEKLVDLADRWRQKLDMELAKFQSVVKDRMYGTKDKSNQLSKKLERQITSKVVYPDEKDIEEVRREVELKTSTLEQRPDDFNKTLRSRISEKLERDVRNEVSLVFQDEANKIFNEIIEIFCHTLEGVVAEVFPEKKMDLLKNEELKKTIEGFVRQEEFIKMYEVSALVMRFAGDIIEIMLVNPMTSTDRENKFEEIHREIYSLAAFYKDFNPEKPLKTSGFVTMVKGSRTGFKKILDADLRNLESILKDVQGFTKNSLTEIVNELRTLGIDVEVIIKKLQELQPKSIQEVWNILRRLDVGTNYVSAPTSYDEVLEEIKTDIDNFKVIVEEVIVRAVYPEKAFINAFSLYIRELINKLRLGTEKGEDFKAMLRKVRRIISEEYGADFKKKSRFSWLAMKTVEDLRRNLSLLA